MLQKLFRALYEKCPDKKKIILQHANACPHSACLCMERS